MDIENINNHNAVLYNRGRMELSGIIDVISFSENSVEAEYGEGTIIVEGEDMKIEDFSGEYGKLTVIGRINGFYYFNKKRKEPKRLFGGSRR